MAKYVYVAGPYSQGDVALNVRNVILAAEKLANAGMTPYVPHLSHFWHLLCPHELDFWYQFDLDWLIKCDCLVRLPGVSTGADAEVEFAISRLFIPVFSSVEECIQYFERRPGWEAVKGFVYTEVNELL